MIAYKGFNKDLTCTKGKGVYQYEIGKTYEEEEAQCAHCGFHCVEEPIRVLDWYEDGRWCVVEVQDIHEDGDDRISAKKMKILKELTLHQLYAHEAAWIMTHPDRKCSDRVSVGEGTADKDDAVIVRGSRPRARGDLGSLLVLVREKRKKVEEIRVFLVDGVDVLPGKWYRSEAGK